MTVIATAAAVVATLTGSASAFEGQPIALRTPEVEVTGLQIHGVGLDDAAPVTAEVSGVLHRYLDGAVVTGLLTGQPADVGEAFTAAARARLTSDDRPILVEEAGPQPAIVDVRHSRAELWVLTGPGRVAEVVVAKVSHLAVGMGGEAGQVRVSRDGQLVLLHEDGAWRIDSYDVTIDRHRDGVPPLALLWPFGLEA